MIPLAHTQNHTNTKQTKHKNGYYRNKEWCWRRVQRKWAKDSCKEKSGIQQFPNKVSKRQSKSETITGGKEESKETRTSASRGHATMKLQASSLAKPQKRQLEDTAPWKHTKLTASPPQTTNSWIQKREALVASTSERVTRQLGATWPTLRA